MTQDTKDKITGTLVYTLFAIAIGLLFGVLGGCATATPPPSSPATTMYTHHVGGAVK